MAEKIVRMKLPENLYKRFKLLCVQKDLSMPKQNAELVRKFVEVMESNPEIVRK